MTGFLHPIVDKPDFEQEAILEPTIQFPNALTSHPLNPRVILLTGATGLLGMYLLDELLHKTQAVIYCLVRAGNAIKAKERLIYNLQFYDLWCGERCDARIIPIAGDISKTRLGLSEARFHQLAGEVDVIYHSAGIINMSYSYKQLRSANVEGVKEILRLSGLVHTKPLHFISSIAVFYSDAHPADKVLKENDIPQYHHSIKGNYGKSKWVADRLVACAQERGLPACIYRPTRITGHSKTGVINNTTEIFPMLLKGCIQIGRYPNWDIEITMVPADYISKAIVYLAGQSSSWGKAFHFFNHKPISWRDLMGIVKEFGYPLQEISYKQWQNEIKFRASRDAGENSDDRKFYASLVLVFMGLHYLFFKRPHFDGQNVQEGIANAGIICPPVDRKLIETYIAYWMKTGFLPCPFNLTAQGKN